MRAGFLPPAQVPRAGKFGKRHLGPKAAAAALAIALLVSPAWAREPARTIAGPARVIDGDTLEVAGTKVRLNGLHAPEPTEPGGPAATAWMQRATAGQTVT